MARKTKSAKREKPRERGERRFTARASVSPTIALSIGAIGALVMGAGTWEQFSSYIVDSGPEPVRGAAYVLVLGSVLVAAAIWIGTSGEALLRVGDAGLGVEKRAVKRVPWYAVERVEWRGEAVRVTGKDEFGAATTIVAPVATQPQAAAWIVKEARARVPAVVDVPEDATLPEPNDAAGETIVLDPPQVVGKTCTASGTIIAYEPDACVCPRCERVYHVAHVPESCACGGSLTSLRKAP